MAHVTGLSDLNKDSQPADDDDVNKLYVGGNAQGGGGSGLSVMGPPADGAAGDLAAGIIARAQQGAGSVRMLWALAGHLAARSMAPSGSNTCGIPAVLLALVSLFSGGDASAASRKITLYKNGFTVDDGPYREKDDPANQAFLGALHRGVVPPELQAEGGADLDVRLEDKTSEDYVPPAYVAYSGSGHSMGSSAAADGALVSSGSSADALEQAVVDDSKPKTTIAVRLHTGKRLRLSLNHTHTIRHIMAAIQAEGAGDVSYVLMAGFPPSQITDFNQTVEEAGLCGSQITQTKQA